MGIKGTVRRGPDGHIIHANIDTDVIIAEEPPYGLFKRSFVSCYFAMHFSRCRNKSPRTPTKHVHTFSFSPLHACSMKASKIENSKEVLVSGFTQHGEVPFLGAC